MNSGFTLEIHFSLNFTFSLHLTLFPLFSFSLPDHSLSTSITPPTLDQNPLPASTAKPCHFRPQPCFDSSQQSLANREIARPRATWPPLFSKASSSSSATFLSNFQPLHVHFSTLTNLEPSFFAGAAIH